MIGTSQMVDQDVSTLVNSVSHTLWITTCKLNCQSSSNKGTAKTGKTKIHVNFAILMTVLWTALLIVNLLSCACCCWGCSCHCSCCSSHLQTPCCFCNCCHLCNCCHSSCSCCPHNYCWLETHFPCLADPTLESDNHPGKYLYKMAKRYITLKKKLKLP